MLRRNNRLESIERAVLLAGRTGILQLLFIAAPVAAFAQASGSVRHAIMPAPAEFRAGEGRLSISADCSIAIRGHDDARLRAGLARALRRQEERTGLTFARTSSAAYLTIGAGDAFGAASASLLIECLGPGLTVPKLGEDESYALDAGGDRVSLNAPTVVGALRGFETFMQLLRCDASGWFSPEVAIRGRPRFHWRRLLIDGCRHRQPMDVFKRNLDGMALPKLDVLHLRLTDDQGFRIESKRFLRLHEMGSDGKYFTQDDIREIVAYAAERAGEDRLVAWGREPLHGQSAATTGRMNFAAER